jgi:hypothetical protein
MTALILYPILCATFFYLLSRAVVTSWLWTRYPRWLAAFLDCASCSGTWIGLILAIVGGHVYDLDFLGLDGESPSTWPVVALCSTLWTPLVAALHQKALEFLGTAIMADPETPPMSIPEMTPTPSDSTMPIPAIQRMPLQAPAQSPELDSSTSDRKDLA